MELVSSGGTLPKHLESDVEYRLLDAGFITYSHGMPVPTPAGEWLVANVKEPDADSPPFPAGG
nr:hypothetical protein [Panacagrimonas sp.]